MENYTLNVINLYKHNIVYKTKQRKKSFKSFSVVFVLLALNFVLFASGLFIKDFGSLLATASSGFANPVNPLYNEMGDIIFTSSGKMFEKYNVEKDVQLLVPILTNKIAVKPDHIEFEVSEKIIIVSPADGVVLKVSSSDEGKKTIEIKHSKNLTTRFENVDIAGIVPGDEVKAGSDIASAKIGDKVKFYVVLDGSNVTNLKINKTQVEWQS